MRRIGLALVSFALLVFLGSCQTYMYRGICFSAGTKIYDGHVEVNRPLGAELLDLDVHPRNGWLRTADGAYISGDCVVQPMRIDGKDAKK
ncbi:MAG: hypothetical protein CMN76_02810 [Spirochaetaceae bacterium]|nr:hypothetical protein [Spirochaetaceae bacterium]|tara:strand:+ start:5421 stop:5690 length:270 start_codon:yes stop_codon:yes gene_type:complete